MYAGKSSGVRQANRKHEWTDSGGRLSARVGRFWCVPGRLHRRRGLIPHPAPVSRSESSMFDAALAAREDDDPLIRGIARATAIGEYAKPGPRSPVYARLHELRLQLAEVRAYSPPRPS